MPLLQLEVPSPDFAWALWEITEPAESLWQALQPAGAEQKYLKNIAHPGRRTQSVAARLVAKAVLTRWKLPYSGLAHDADGQPQLEAEGVFISLSHTAGYAAAALHRSRKTGIDIERISPKLQKAAPRILNAAELSAARENNLGLATYWCAKEVLYKLCSHRGVDFRQELAIDPFLFQNQGRLTGHIRTSQQQATVEVAYQQQNDLLVAFGCL